MRHLTSGQPVRPHRRVSCLQHARLRPDVTIPVRRVRAEQYPVKWLRTHAQWAKEKIDLIFTTGGTGFGPKDLTPEATRKVIDKEAPGITETMRRHGKERTPYAMLSRELAGMRNQSIIINLPGSSKGAQESLEALFPGLLHIFPMIWGGGHEKNN